MNEPSLPDGSPVSDSRSAGPADRRGLARLDGKVAMVTGAGSGIGSVIARQLAEAGANVALMGRTETALDDVCSAIREDGGRALSTPADIRDPNAVAAAVRRCEDTLGPVDLLVHCAAWARGQVFLCEQTEEEWLRTIDTNLNGAFRICRQVVPGMMRRRSGGIVLISSIAGKRGLPANTAYCASKFGINGLTQSLATELGPFGIRVNAVCPGLTRSPGTTDPERYGDDFMASLARHHGPANLDWSRYVRSAIRSTALRRLVEPEEVANQVTFLLSDLSDGITGQAIGVDAGVL